MEIVLRASIIFMGVFLLTRGMRKRSFGELSPFEMIMLVSMGDIIQQGITQEDYSLTGAALAVGTFAFWIMVLTRLSWRYDRARKLIEGVPLVLVRDGEPVDAALKLEQMPLEEILEAARQQGVGDLAEIRYAVLEVSGKISIIKAA